MTQQAPELPANLTAICDADNPMTLCAYVKQAVDIYFAQMDGHETVNLHALVMCEVEKPLLEAALSHCGHNQTKASKVLGLSRSTLRKKLDSYGIT